MNMNDDASSALRELRRIVGTTAQHMLQAPHHVSRPYAIHAVDGGSKEKVVSD